jgi:hypothetical protein
MLSGKRLLNCRKVREGNEREVLQDINKLSIVIYLFTIKKPLMSKQQNIIIKNAKQIENIKISGKHLTTLLRLLYTKAKAGISLIELEFIAEHYIKTNNIK